MRLWSLHPAHLDQKGLVAWWREGLLAQAVLAGRTKGYTRHPQLERFRETADPVAAIGAHLGHVAHEASVRGYRFDAGRILVPEPREAVLDGALALPPIEVTTGQLAFEWAHLGTKLAVRGPGRWAAGPVAHPGFVVVPGPIASWERP